MGCGLEVYIDDESVDEKLITELWNNRAKSDEVVHSAGCYRATFQDIVEEWLQDEGFCTGECNRAGASKRLFEHLSSSHGNINMAKIYEVSKELNDIKFAIEKNSEINKNSESDAIVLLREIIWWYEHRGLMGSKAKELFEKARKLI